MLDELHLSIKHHHNLIAFERMLEGKPLTVEDGYNSKITRRFHERIVNSKNMREKLMKKQNNLCVDCGNNIAGKATVDHVVPVRFGGVSHMHNLEAVCFKCNRKRDMAIDSKKTYRHIEKFFGESISIFIKDNRNAI